MHRTMVKSNILCSSVLDYINMISYQSGYGISACSQGFSGTAEAYLSRLVGWIMFV